MSDLCDVISKAIRDTRRHSIRVFSVEPEILLLMHYEIAYQFYNCFWPHEPAFDNEGDRRPYMGATIIVSRDIKEWRVVCVTGEREE